MSHLLNGMLLGTRLGKNRNYQDQIKYLLGSNLFAWYPFTEPIGVSGTSVADISGNGYNGIAWQDFVGGFAGPGSRSAIYTTGSFKGINTYSAAEGVAFKTQCGDHGSACFWAKVPDWAGATRNIINYQSASTVDQLLISHNITSDRTQFQRVANSLTEVTTEASGQTSTLWRWYCMTWSTTDDQLIAYVNNAQVGTTQTGLAAWQNNLASAGSVLLNNYVGLVSDIIIASRVLTLAERNYIYTKA